jgi:signal transduction histidine kinase
MGVVLRKNVIYFVVALISILLVLNIFLTRHNNEIIAENDRIQEEVEKVGLFYDQIGKSVIHSLDIGLRGYAIVKNKKFVTPLDNGIKWKDSILNSVETPLKKLGYHSTSYEAFKDSLNSYVVYATKMKQLLAEGRDQEFVEQFTKDKGAHLWHQYVELERDIKGFANRLDQEAQRKYENALFRNQLIQVLLFLICFPTLLYTAFYTIKTYQLSEMLRVSQEDRNKMLFEQNIVLERRIAERTQEITTQNEEIVSQSEELSTQRDALEIQNKQLYEAQKTIELQHEEIQSMNKQLRNDVTNRTEELREANKHLLEQNNQLEQFAFIAAHNLRAPLTRILGLANIIQISDTDDDRDLALEKLVTSTKDLDFVIRDLNTILNIRRQTSNMAEVDLQETLERVKRTLEREIEDTNTVVTHNFDDVHEVFAVRPYVESILYNLISNAIKYRDPERIPIISLETIIDEDFTCLTVTDNGLGIDLAKHKQNVFNLYKRFHLHMEGRGLGLYLVRTQIEAMGGKIEIKSEPNEGTTFFVYFKRFII